MKETQLLGTALISGDIVIIQLLCKLLFLVTSSSLVNVGDLLHSVPFQKEGFMVEGSWLCSGQALCLEQKEPASSDGVLVELGSETTWVIVLWSWLSGNIMEKF